jgi:hypothetical protein
MGAVFLGIISKEQGCAWKPESFNSLDQENLGTMNEENPPEEKKTGNKRDFFPPGAWGLVWNTR